MQRTSVILMCLNLCLLNAPSLAMAEPGDEEKEKIEKKEVILTAKQCEILGSSDLNARVLQSKKTLSDLMIACLIALPSTVLWSITTRFHYQYHAGTLRNSSWTTKRTIDLIKPLCKKPWLLPPLLYGAALVPVCHAYQNYKQLKFLKKIKTRAYYSVRCENSSASDLPSHLWDE
jgi:hypothetical protein